MLDRRRDVNVTQGIVVAVLGLLSTVWGWLVYRNVADALRAGLQGVVVALFTTGLFIMVTGMRAKRRLEPDSERPLATSVFRERLTAAEDARKPTNRLVACFDVLGFTPMVESTPLGVLASKYEQLIREIDRNRSIDIRTRGGRLVGLDRWGAPHAVFSDTLLFWSDPDPDSAWLFLKLCAQAVQAAVDLRMPLRGGIAYGEAIMDRDTGTYLGMALVNAHRTEAAQNWVGVGLHESCESSSELAHLVSHHEDVAAYAVPVKEGTAPRHALLWHQYMAGADGVLAQLQVVAPPKDQAKYTNAIKFVRAFPA